MKHYELPWPSRWPARLRPARPRRARPRAHRVRQLAEALPGAARPGGGAVGRVLFHRARRDLRHHRPQRRGQVHLAAHHQHAGAPRRRPRADRRRRCRAAGRGRAGGAAAPHRHDLPALQPAVGQDRGRERGAAAARGRRQARRRASGSTRCWTWWACATRPMPIRPSCPAARSSGSASPARWCTSRGSCCATKPRRRWIPRPPNPSWRCCATSTASSA